jgi:hypothetical protein
MSSMIESSSLRQSSLGRPLRQSRKRSQAPSRKLSGTLQDGTGTVARGNPSAKQRNSAECASCNLTNASLTTPSLPRRNLKYNMNATDRAWDPTRVVLQHAVFALSTCSFIPAVVLHSACSLTSTPRTNCPGDSAVLHRECFTQWADSVHLASTEGLRPDLPSALSRVCTNTLRKYSYAESELRVQHGPSSTHPPVLIGSRWAGTSRTRHCTKYRPHRSASNGLLTLCALQGRLAPVRRG